MLIGIRLPKELEDSLRGYCGKHMASTSKVVRRAIAEFLVREATAANATSTTIKESDHVGTDQA